jgi:hypothetical protein
MNIQRLRMSTALRLYTWCLMKALPGMIKLIVGSEGLTEVVREMLKFQSGELSELESNAANYGVAREASQLISNLDRAAGMFRPDTPWTFHKDQWGEYEVTVLPRVIDSNTGVIVGPSGHPNIGSVVTDDHCAPNCDPSALDAILYGSPVKEEKTA